MSSGEVKDSIEGKVGRLDATYLKGTRVHSELSRLYVSHKALRGDGGSGVRGDGGEEDQGVRSLCSRDATHISDRSRK